LLMGHGAEQLLLRFYVQIFKNVGGERIRQKSKNDNLLVLRQVENQFGHVRRRPFPENLPERPEITFRDQVPNFRNEDFSDHIDERRAPGSFLASARAERNHWRKMLVPFRGAEARLFGRRRSLLGIRSDLANMSRMTATATGTMIRREIGEDGI